MEKENPQQFGNDRAGDDQIDGGVALTQTRLGRRKVIKPTARRRIEIIRHQSGEHQCLHDQPRDHVRARRA
jgi:hypothetical protein